MPTISAKDLVEYVEFLHERSMQNAESAFIVKQKSCECKEDVSSGTKLLESAKRLFCRAYSDEIRAADHANQIREEFEPTTSILYRGAANLAHNAGMKEEAKAAAVKCLAGKFAAEFKEEMMPYIEGGE